MFENLERINELFEKLCPDSLVESTYSNFSNYERSQVMLVETRGMAGSKYENLFKEMCAAVKEYIDYFYDDENAYEKYYRIKTLPNGEKQKIEIKQFKTFVPQELASKIQEFADLEISVNCLAFEDIKDPTVISNYINGEGCCGVDRFSRMDSNGKLPLAEMNITCICINGVFNDYSFLNNIRHEYNHLAEIYNRAKKGKESDYINAIRTKYSQKVALIKSSDKEDRIVGYLLYALWTKSELNAHATSAYSYLDSINSKRKDFGKDIQKSECYQIYSKIKDEYLPYIEQLPMNEKHWKNYSYLLEENWGEKNPTKFKNQFIKHTKRLLSLFFNKIVQVGEYYYMEHPENDIINNNPHIRY